MADDVLTCASPPAARLFAETEGVVTALESAHGLRYAIDEAIRYRETGEKKAMAFNNCGHGLLDLSAYEEFNAGRLQDWEPGEFTVPEYAKGR